MPRHTGTDWGTKAKPLAVYSPVALAASLSELLPEKSSRQGKRIGCVAGRWHSFPLAAFGWQMTLARDPRLSVNDPLSALGLKPNHNSNGKYRHFRGSPHPIDVGRLDSIGKSGTGS